MTNEEQVRRAVGDAGILALLLSDHSPEEVEAILEGTLPFPGQPTALSDPTNVLMQEVSDGSPPRTG